MADAIETPLPLPSAESIDHSLIAAGQVERDRVDELLCLCDDTLKALRTIRILAESADAHLELYQGCEIDRYDTSALFEVIEARAAEAAAQVASVLPSISNFLVTAGLANPGLRVSTCTME